MAHGIEKLSARSIEKILRTPGMYCDGGGLWLRVQSSTSRSWVFRYMRDHVSHKMGLGKYPEVSLAKAREYAAEARRTKAEGSDPLAERKARQIATKIKAAKVMTFRQCGEAYVDTHKAGWKNEKHIWQWTATLSAHAYPVFGELPVGEVDVSLVMKVLEPIWHVKNETASRLRGRIEAILDWAKVRGHRSGDNPARWRGHLDKLLPARTRVRKVEHHPALPYKDMPSFMAKLRVETSFAARALEFLILTAGRTGEIVGAKWPEFNLGEKLWVVPGERMKSGREHRVPLCEAAIRILEALKPQGATSDGYVFAKETTAKPLSNMAMLMLLRRMGFSQITAHGFRSTFRDWVSECTDFSGEVAEMALAHVVEDDTEAAYRRGDLLRKRRSLMTEWATMCTDPPKAAVEEPGQSMAAA
jgi:integrase